MVIHVAYYSITFIVGLFMLGRILTIRSEEQDVDREDIKRYFSIYCVGFVAWSGCTVVVGAVNNTVVDHAFLLFGEFARMCSFIVGAELFAAITDSTIGKKRTLVTISSDLLYFGVLVLAVRLFCDKAVIKDGLFSAFYVMNTNPGLILYILFHVVVLFFYCAYTYMYSYTCTKKREFYISKQCILIVGILILCLCIESFFYAMSSEYVPTMYVGMLISIFIFKRLIEYKRSVVYNERDYQSILSPSHSNAAFVCNDEGRIIFENTRAYVMQQTYKDEYHDKYLTDIFDITDYDKERLKEPRITQTFVVYCKYPKQSIDVVLSVRHRLDKYGSIFATEVELVPGDNPEKVNTLLVLEEESVTSHKEIISVDYYSLNDIRTRELVNQLERQKHIIEEKNDVLFLLNLKGISKLSSVLGLSHLEDLCSRIQTEVTYGGLDGLEAMLIEMDRQYETLRLFPTMRSV